MWHTLCFIYMLYTFNFYLSLWQIKVCTCRLSKYKQSMPHDVICSRQGDNLCKWGWEVTVSELMSAHDAKCRGLLTAATCRCTAARRVSRLSVGTLCVWVAVCECWWQATYVTQSHWATTNRPATRWSWRLTTVMDECLILPYLQSMWGRSVSPAWQVSLPTHCLLLLSLSLSLSVCLSVCLSHVSPAQAGAALRNWSYSPHGRRVISDDKPRWFSDTYIRACMHVCMYICVSKHAAVTRLLSMILEIILNIMFFNCTLSCPSLNYSFPCSLFSASRLTPLTHSLVCVCIFT